MDPLHSSEWSICCFLTVWNYLSQILSLVCDYFLRVLFSIRLLVDENSTCNSIWHNAPIFEQTLSLAHLSNLGCNKTKKWRWHDQSHPWALKSNHYIWREHYSVNNLLWELRVLNASIIQISSILMPWLHDLLLLDILLRFIPFCYSPNSVLFFVVP